MNTETKEPTEDFKEFGDTYVYCNQHLGVHKTGWCTVNVRNKVALGNLPTVMDAAQKARDFGLVLYSDKYPNG